MSHISHEQIVNKFIQSKSIDFSALGKFISENGADIASSSRGDYGVRIGHYNILACFKNIVPAVDLGSLGIGAGEIAGEVVGRGQR
jgi:hypothetical protein